jgi:hypothetical protein
MEQDRSARARGQGKEEADVKEAPAARPAGAEAWVRDAAEEAARALVKDKGKVNAEKTNL